MQSCLHQHVNMISSLQEDFFFTKFQSVSSPSVFPCLGFQASCRSINIKDNVTYLTIIQFAVEIQNKDHILVFFECSGIFFLKSFESSDFIIIDRLIAFASRSVRSLTSTGATIFSNVDLQWRSLIRRIHLLIQSEDGQRQRILIFRYKKFDSSEWKIILNQQTIIQNWDILGVEMIVWRRGFRHV